MSTVTNKALNTGSMTNKAISAQDYLLVGDATMLVGDATMFVGETFAIHNKTINTASMTNKTIS